MTCDCKDNKPYTVESAMDLDIDDLASVPDYFIGIRTITKPDTGAVVASPVRIPGAKVMPTGNLANVVALPTNNEGLNIPEKQVRAGYIDVQPGRNIMRLANSNNPAMFLMIGEYTNGKMLVQSTGFLTIPSGHNYVTGLQYYLGDEGEPVTDSVVTGQKLFMPLDDYTLNINGDF